MTKDELLIAYAKGERSFVYADLRGAVLQNADLFGANLFGADLRGADLRGAYLRGANLFDADLQDADLRGAVLQNANLFGAKLRGSKLRGADLRGAYLPYYQIVPERGEYVAYKKLANKMIAEIIIPSKAKRTSSLCGRKCRASFCKTTDITSLDGKTHYKEGVSDHDNKTLYRVGKITRPDKYDDDIRVDCSNGIHHFITRSEAVEY